MHYIITFVDGSTFKANSEEAMWNKMPNKNIKKLEYWVSSERSIILQDFEQYNHIIKHGFGLNNSIKGVIGILLLGKKGRNVMRIGINPQRKQISQEFVEWGKEYNDKPHPGWKLGIISDVKPYLKL